MNVLRRRVTQLALPIAVFATLLSCGGGGGTTPPPTTYSIGGAVSGLDSGESALLQDNGGDGLTVSANGAFTFVTAVASGGAYSVTAMAPAGKTCTVTAGQGTASADVTNVAVACAPTPPQAMYPVSVSVSGLVGDGLALEQRVPNRYGGPPAQTHMIEIQGNGHFVFQSPIALNQGSVNVSQHPSSPKQVCVVSGAHDTAGGGAREVSISCAEFAAVTNAAGNTISTFSVDAATGALASTGPPVTAGPSPHAIVGTPDKNHLYVNNSDDVSAFAVDVDAGALASAGPAVVGGTHPAALALYSAAIGRGPSHVAYLYVANAGSGDLSAYGVVEGTDDLTALSPASYTVGTGPSAIAINQSVTISQSPAFLYTANAGSGDISAFLMDATTGGLTPVAGAPFPSASSISSLAVGTSNPQRQGFLYAANASGGTAAIYGFSVDGDGALTSLAGFPFALPSCRLVVTDHTGTLLYAAVGATLVGYLIDRVTGVLTPLAGFPVAIGASAQSISVDPTNQFLYVANGSAGTISGFRLSEDTGALTAIAGSPFAAGAAADVVAAF